jgi:hypothetical protein
MTDVDALLDKAIFARCGELAATNRPTSLYPQARTFLPRILRREYPATFRPFTENFILARIEALIANGRLSYGPAGRDKHRNPIAAVQPR